MNKVIINSIVEKIYANIMENICKEVYFNSNAEEYVMNASVFLKEIKFPSNSYRDEIISVFNEKYQTDGFEIRWFTAYGYIDDKVLRCVFK